jgi:hypothetical protein
MVTIIHDNTLTGIVKVGKWMLKGNTIPVKYPKTVIGKRAVPY